jgi:hypothetical protein
VIERRYVRDALAQFGVQRLGGCAVVGHGVTQVQEISADGFIYERLCALRAGEATSNVDLTAKGLCGAIPSGLSVFGSWWSAPARR